MSDIEPSIIPPPGSVLDLAQRLHRGEDIPEDITQREIPRDGTELLKSAATLGMNGSGSEFGVNFIDLVIEQQIEAIILMGETNNGKTIHGKQIQAALKQRGIESIFFTQDQAIGMIKQRLVKEYPEELHHIINDTSLWGYHIPQAWDLVSNIMTRFVEEDVVDANGMKLEVVKILEVTGVGRPDENKGKTTIQDISENPNIKSVVLGVVAEEEMREETLWLRDREKIKEIPEEEFLDVLEVNNIVMVDFPEDALNNRTICGRLAKQMYMNKAQLHRIMAYAAEMEQHREAHEHEFKSRTEIADYIPADVLRKRSIQRTIDIYLDRVRQMEYIMKTEYNLPDDKGFVYLNRLRRSARTEHYEPNTWRLFYRL